MMKKDWVHAYFFFLFFSFDPSDAFDIIDYKESLTPPGPSRGKWNCFCVAPFFNLLEDSEVRTERWVMCPKAILMEHVTRF